jgi:hypothetical protein
VRSALVALVCAGCLDELGPEVGQLTQPRCVDVDSDPETDVRFEADIRLAIFDRDDVHCTRCHTPDGETPLGIQVSGLDLTSLKTLRAGGIQSADAIIEPGAACGSVLIQKLGPAPPFGARMPLDGPPYLSIADLQVISDWIVEGARDN